MHNRMQSNANSGSNIIIVCHWLMEADLFDDDGPEHFDVQGFG